jgi:hypothetical protein
MYQECLAGSRLKISGYIHTNMEENFKEDQDCYRVAEPVVMCDTDISILAFIGRTGSTLCVFISSTVHFTFL